MHVFRYREYDIISSISSIDIGFVVFCNVSTTGSRQYILNSSKSNQCNRSKNIFSFELSKRPSELSRRFRIRNSDSLRPKSYGPRAISLFGCTYQLIEIFQLRLDRFKYCIQQQLFLF